ncbi:MAG TPA: beta-ketoacyl-[acyl-carrier-protein] synthase II [Elusimicrobia bacterium]|jgi:3-oxoacyl-[acyl-carrier-protein] synthase II|nr:beta-ketoacyl-[acyl-carrier-protein] synthase II [Elusimicrobiota bacterium]
MKRRVVVTGLGIVAPNGIGKDNYWQAIRSGVSGIDKISSFDVSEYPVKIAGEVKDFNPHNYMGKKEAKLLGRFAQFALSATRMAVEDARIDLTKEDEYEVGVAIGTALGGFEIGERECANFHKKGLNTVHPFSAIAMNPNSAVGVIALEFKVKGPNMTISTGCSAGISALGYAYDIISNEKAKVMLAGGSEAPLLPVTFDSFCQAQVLTKRNGDPTKASRPFDRLRDGYVLGEGAGIVILEELNHALARGAKIYAEILGYAMTNDGYSMLKMEPTGKEVAKTISLALQEAGLNPENIDYICAHGSSSIVADKRETQAIKLALGEHAYKVAISSIKSMIGQSLSASASLQFITAVLAMENNCIPPTINYEYPDPECDLNYVPNSVCERPIKTALLNSFGLGGNITSLLMHRYAN